MKAKRLLEATPKTFALVFERGDSVMETCTPSPAPRGSRRLADGIGAFSEARAGFFDFDAKKYRPIRIGLDRPRS